MALYEVACGPAQRVEGGIGGHFARKYHRETVHASLRSDKIISSLFVTPEIGISPDFRGRGHPSHFQRKEHMFSGCYLNHKGVPTDPSRRISGSLHRGGDTPDSAFEVSPRVPGVSFQSNIMAYIECYSPSRQSDGWRKRVRGWWLLMTLPGAVSPGQPKGG